MPRLSGWKLAQNKLSRMFEFRDFVDSLSFINSLVAYFETIDHHPDVHIGMVIDGLEVGDEAVDEAERIHEVPKLEHSRKLVLGEFPAGQPRHDGRSCFEVRIFGLSIAEGRPYCSGLH